MLDPDSVSADCRRLVVARRPSEIKAKAALRCESTKTSGSGSGKAISKEKKTDEPRSLSAAHTFNIGR
jgi:hypothetical protein